MWAPEAGDWFEGVLRDRLTRRETLRFSVRKFGSLPIIAHLVSRAGTCTTLAPSCKLRQRSDLSPASKAQRDTCWRGGPSSDPGL